MPNTEHFPENWPSWEIDPSTRTSVHVWNKYVPVDVSVGTSAVDLVTVSRGEPSVNLVNNPSIEHATITEFTASGAAISQSSAQAATGSNSLLVNPANAAAGEGFYWTHTFAGHSEGTHIVAQCEVRGASASGDVKLAIQDSSGTELLATSTVNLSTSFQRLTISYQIPDRIAAAYRVAVVSVTNHNIDFYVDKIHVEQRRDGTVQTYVDGAQGLNYEWFGTANLSPSKRRPGLSVVRGLKLKNGHGSQTVYIALDNTASSTTGVLLKAGETWETNWPIDVRTNISALASGASTQVYGVVYGVHEG
tara:strand:+ start:595 stop:1512 length:918 start_codon:yes stop_codon:yes gene_type:complete